MPDHRTKNNHFLNESAENYSFGNNSETNEDIELRLLRFFLANCVYFPIMISNLYRAI